MEGEGDMGGEKRKGGTGVASSPLIAVRPHLVAAQVAMAVGDDSRPSMSLLGWDGWAPSGAASKKEDPGRRSPPFYY